MATIAASSRTRLVAPATDNLITCSTSGSGSTKLAPALPRSRIDFAGAALSSSHVPQRNAVSKAKNLAVHAVAEKTAQASEASSQDKKRFYFVIANAKFMLDEEEHFQEILKERLRHFGETGREQDFWIVHEPAFLDSMPDIAKRVKRPAAALVSTDRLWMIFMKLRLDRVVMGEFEGTVGEALASTSPVPEFEKPDNWVAPYEKYSPGWWKPYLPPGSA